MPGEGPFDRGPMWAGGVYPSATMVWNGPPPTLFVSVYDVLMFSAPRRMLKNVEGSSLTRRNVNR